MTQRKNKQWFKFVGDFFIHSVTPTYFMANFCFFFLNYAGTSGESIYERKIVNNDILGYKLVEKPFMYVVYCYLT